MRTIGLGALRRYIKIWPALLGISLTTTAQADCPPGQEPFTSCQIEGRNTEVFVCHDWSSASYSYGPIGGAPDLFLTETIENVDYEPWSGSGKAIHETVTFYNGDYSYEVGGGFDRPFSEEEMELGNRHFGWLEIARNGQRLGELTCIPETVSYGFGGGIYDAKRAAGLEWDEDSMTWLPDANLQPVRAAILTQDECLPFTEFALGGISMGDPAAILGNLGPPETRQEDTRSLDQIERYNYDDLSIIILQDQVAEISATSPQWETPSGLKVGLTRGEVIRTLGRLPYGAAATSQLLAASVCAHNQGIYDEWFFLIEFGQDKRVQRISLEIAWP